MRRHDDDTIGRPKIRLVAPSEARRAVSVQVMESHATIHTEARAIAHPALAGERKSRRAAWSTR